MKRAALGVRMHSGWGVVVAVTLGENSVEVLDRRRIVTVDPKLPGAKQPYHYAAEMGVQAQELPEAERYIANCTEVSERLAASALEEVIRDLERRSYRVTGCAVLIAAGRPLPPLARILAAHPLIHTAEGEFFRNTVRKACEGLHIPVMTVRERELEALAKAAFGTEMSPVQKSILSAGKLVGPPWTQDHKAAALAAAMILGQEKTIPSRRSTA